MFELGDCLINMLESGIKWTGTSEMERLRMHNK